MSNDDTAGFQSRVTINATAGVVYQIVVDGYDGVFGTVKLNRAPGAAAPTADSPQG